MVSDFICPVIGKASDLGVSLYENTSPVELCPGDSLEAIATVIRAVYRQVLGNAYVMESERLTIAESKLIEGRISVREFVRKVAYSNLYKSRFFDNCPRYRSIELNFKHLLGRAPDSYEETNLHSQILDQSGYCAEIDSYVDSEEYHNRFGENIVPYYCGYKTQTGKSIVGFTRIFQLLRGASSSDKKLTTKDEPRLTSSLVNKVPSNIVLPSSVNSYGGLTDINKLLANVLSSSHVEPESNYVQSTYRIRVSSDDSFIEPSGSYVGGENVQDDLEQKIVELRQRLANLSSFATIGAADNARWQTAGLASDDSFPQSISNINDKKASTQEIIADLERKVADAQRLANLGETRLNKWRKRSFF